MKAVVTRVKNASVTIDGEIKGSIDKGCLVLLGVGPDDTEKEAVKLADKVCGCRVFEDENGKMNLNLETVGGELLIISQFTLCADLKKGNRPSFFPSAAPETANRLYEYFCSCLAQQGIKTVEKGVFGADMQVEINNDGPVTILMDTDIWKK